MSCNTDIFRSLKIIKITRLILLSLSLTICSIFSAPLARANQICKKAIRLIADETDVPVELLMAISEVESQFKPYAVNHNGESLSFSSSGEALEYVESQLDQGESNIDMGCMQINWRSHQENFADPRDLFIPTHNVRYAANFLKSLYKELGSWAKATAAYHSRHPERGEGYLLKVSKILKQGIYQIDNPSMRNALFQRVHFQRVIPSSSSGHKGILPVYRGIIPVISFTNSLSHLVPD